MEIYGLQREQHVYFSNQEYYRRLEELKSAHLRNMAELERMYISQGGERRGEEDDGGLGQGRNREARQSIRFDMPCDSLINRRREKDVFAPKATVNVEIHLSPILKVRYRFIKYF